MQSTIRELERRYRLALEVFIELEGEDALQKAYEVGRDLIAGGLGILELSTLHKAILCDLLNRVHSPKRAATIVQRAMNFFSESLSPFEMTLRAFRENNDKLQHSLEQLDSTRLAVETERQRYRAQFDFAPDGYFVTDLNGVIEEANIAAAVLLHMKQDVLVGQSLSHFLKEEDQHTFENHLLQLRSGAIERVRDWQMTMNPEMGRPFPAFLTVAVVRDKSEMPVGLRWLVRDITDFRRAETERSDFLVRDKVARANAEGARRLAFLAEASTLLASSLDSETTLGSVAQFAVPFLADWCFVYVMEDDGSVRRLSVAHGDPLNRDVARSLEEMEAPIVPDWAGNALRFRKPEIVNNSSRNLLESIIPADRYAQASGKLVSHSALIVPLVARERTLGVMLFVSAESGRVFNASDEVLVEDLGRRCAFAVDNARLHGEVIMQRDKAEKASRAKDEFLAILSHELRNPLVPILGWARIFRNQAAITSDEVLAEGVASLERNARNIQRLVDDCLDRVRSSTRTVRLAMEQIDLNQVVVAAIEASAPLGREKEIKLDVQLANRGVWVVGDRMRLEQVITNLLTNAIKFTSAGGSVHVRSDAAEGLARVEVVDSGIGIAPEFLNQIFEPFRQNSAAWLASDSGIGLGLSIAREITQLHSGRVWAESEGLNRGSTFVVTLPLVSVAAPDPPAVDGKSQPEADTLPERHVRVLVVEDSKDVLFLMKKELEWVGFTVYTAADGQSGLEIARQEVPDVIVSDIRMPGMDGYQFMEKLREIPSLVSVPAIALTGFGMERDVAQARAVGYTQHMVKPVDLPQLITVISKLTDIPAA